MNRWVLSFFISIIVVSSLYAGPAEEKGLAIAIEIERNDKGWKDTVADMKMILRNRQGSESARTIKVKTLEMNKDGDKSLIVFNTPRDIKGTAFLTFSHVIVADQQWMFLPALKRVKRISSANKSGPFMGSQFAYEDIVSFEVDKFKYKYLRNEKIDGRDSYVVETYPQYKYSGYRRQIVWVDTERKIPVKIEYYDRKNSLLKSMVFMNYQQYLGQYWRAGKQKMLNHQNGKSTVIIWTNYKFRTGLASNDFDRSTLKRAR